MGNKYTANKLQCTNQIPFALRATSTLNTCPINYCVVLSVKIVMLKLKVQESEKVPHIV